MLPQFPLIRDALLQVTQVKASQGLYEVFKIRVPAEGLFIDTELGCLCFFKLRCTQNTADT